MNNKNLKLIYNQLYKKFGKQHWWPIDKTYHTKHKSDARFEICIGAILTQNTAWKNVEKAINNLKNNNLLNKKALKNISKEKLASLIKPAGYYNQKAKKLKEFVNFKGAIKRENLLKIWGIGKETADSILLYAYNKPIFVVDAYTKRIFKRLGFREKNYDELQKLFHKNLPKDYKLLNEFHALLVKLGKDYCKKKPNCEECPLKEMCKFNQP